MSATQVSKGARSTDGWGDVRCRLVVMALLGSWMSVVGKGCDGVGATGGGGSGGGACV